jgi:hypothetical protein
MRLRTREQEVREATPGDPAEAGTPRLAAEGADRLAAADAATARHMSGNAEKFLRANRQEGGQ